MAFKLFFFTFSVLFSVVFSQQSTETESFWYPINSQYAASWISGTSTCENLHSESFASSLLAAVESQSQQEEINSQGLFVGRWIG